MNNDQIGWFDDNLFDAPESVNITQNFCPEFMTIDMKLDSLQALETIEYFEQVPNVILSLFGLRKDSN